MVEIWEKIVEDLNSNNDCDLCFYFVGAGRQDYFNNLKPRINPNGDCCVYVGLLKFGYKENKKQSSLGFMESESGEHFFELIVGIPSSLDLQFYNENPDLDILTSKYVKYIKPIIDCVGSGISLDCAPETEGLEISEWRWDLLLNFQDLNLDGIKITGSFKKIYR
ncbi:MAG: hypothetical protein ACRCU6_06005 [Fusobacteriaceae bacterium]